MLRIIESDGVTEDGIFYHSYGIAVDDVSIPDLSLDRAAIERLAARYRDAAKEDLPDIAADFLAEW